jgi:hypothetical protein
MTLAINTNIAGTKITIITAEVTAQGLFLTDPINTYILGAYISIVTADITAYG